MNEQLELDFNGPWWEWETNDIPSYATCAVTKCRKCGIGVSVPIFRRTDDGGIWVECSFMERCRYCGATHG